MEQGSWRGEAVISQVPIFWPPAHWKLACPISLNLPLWLLQQHDRSDRLPMRGPRKLTVSTFLTCGLFVTRSTSSLMGFILRAMRQPNRWRDPRWDEVDIIRRRESLDWWEGWGDASRQSKGQSQGLQAATKAAARISPETRQKEVGRYRCDLTCGWKTRNLRNLGLATSASSLVV